MLFPTAVYVSLVIIHVLCTIAAAGAVFVADFFHIVGIKSHRMERKLFSVNRQLTLLINFGLLGLYVSGILLVVNKPELLDNALFQFKVVLVLIVTINGIFLQKYVAPHMQTIIDKNKPYPANMLTIASLAGSISITTWLMIIFISKSRPHMDDQVAIPYYIAIYLFMLACAFTIAYIMEKRYHKIAKKQHN